MRSELFIRFQGVEQFLKDLHISGYFKNYGSTKGIFMERDTQKTKLAKTLKNKVLFDLAHCWGLLPGISSRS